MTLSLAFAFATKAQAQASDFNEVLDTTNLAWTTGGDAPWFGQTTNTHDSVDAARSGAIGVGQRSWLETSVAGPATVSFFTKTVRESTYPSFAYLSFTVLAEDYPSPGQPSPTMPGLNGWAQQTHDLAAGPNVLRWSFHNYSDTNGADAAFLDRVTIAPPRPLEIIYHPSDRTVYAREMVTLSCYVIGTPPHAFQWLKDGTELAGETNNSIWISSANTSDTGVYSLRVTNMFGSALSSNAVLTVLPPTPPAFVSQPGDQTIYTGQEWNLSAYCSGSPPFTYQWLKNGTNLPGEVWGSLSRTDAQLSDAGEYSVQVSNAEGSVLSHSAVLTVLASAAPILIVYPRSLNMVSGARLLLEAEAMGEPTPQYQWLKNGTNIPGARYSSFSLNNVSAADAGSYSVFVSNLAGTAVSREALIQVLPPLAEHGSWFQPVNQVFVTNGWAFIAQDSLGVGVLSLADPDYPAMVGGCNTDGQASTVRVSGDFAYVADGFAGLQILVITNPAYPIKVGNYDSPGYASDVAVSGNYAFLADGGAGLHVLDVSDPRQPVRVGGFATNMSAGTVRVANGLAYVGCPSVASPIDDPMAPGLQILDISVRTHPVLLGATSQAVNGLDIIRATVLTEHSLFDVSDPSTPTWISSYPFPSLYPRIRTSDVAAAGHLAFVACGSEGVWIFDVSAPSAPVAVARFATAGNARKLCVDGNRIYVVLGESGLQIIEVPPGLGVQPPMGLDILLETGPRLSLNGSHGASYCIEHTENLSSSSWEHLATLTLESPPSVIDLPDFPTEQHFFRVRWLPR